jgi:hypothetical protein
MGYGLGYLKVLRDIYFVAYIKRVKELTNSGEEKLTE